MKKRKLKKLLHRIRLGRLKPTDEWAGYIHDAFNEYFATPKRVPPPV